MLLCRAASVPRAIRGSAPWSPVLRHIEALLPGQRATMRREERAESALRDRMCLC